MQLDELLARVDQVGGSDLHLKYGASPAVRADGTIFSLDDGELTSGELQEVLLLITANSNARREEFERTGELDSVYVTTDGHRFRVNAYRQRGQISLAFRRVPAKPRELGELGMPESVGKLADARHGLVIVAGATGSGKSTTLAGMVARINATRACHIVTIEDPIEVVHEDNESFISQREVGIDTLGFSQALRRVLRQDPDVIVIGEIRDTESAEAALSASESGHLVMATMHTSDTVESIERFGELFPSARQGSVRASLAGALRGVVGQRLLPRRSGGLVAAVEVLVNTTHVADLIRDAERTEELIDVITDGEIHGMQSFDQHLVKLCLAGEIDRSTTLAAATDPHDTEIALQRALRARQTDSGTPNAPKAPPALRTLDVTSSENGAAPESGASTGDDGRSIAQA